MKIYARVLIVAMALAPSAACFDFKVTPSPTTSAVLGGTWSTVQSLPGVSGSLQDACVNFQWSVTQFNGTSGSGTFSATCMGNVAISGSAQGTLSGTTLTWSASGTATIPGMPPCAISLSGTATLETTNRIRIPYSGTTCLGPVSGTEVVQR
jgi:hypothetical protein